MSAKIQRWGNSLALRIPKAFAELAGLQQDTVVELALTERGVLIEPLLKRHFALEHLLAQVTADNLHGEVDTGPFAGIEAW